MKLHAPVLLFAIAVPSTLAPPPDTVTVEPSGAVPYAAVAAERLPVKGQKIGIVLSGGNLDLDSYPWISAS